MKATWSILLMTSESFQETQINISLNLRIRFAWLTNKNRETQDAVRIPYILFIFSTDWCIRSLQSQWLNKTDQAYTNIDKKALILLKNYRSQRKKPKENIRFRKIFESIFRVEDFDNELWKISRYTFQSINCEQNSLFVFFAFYLLSLFSSAIPK